MDKIFLHSCCVGCAIGVVHTLIDELNIRPTLFFYNPNIQPEQEFVKRQEALSHYALLKELPIMVNNYQSEDYLAIQNEINCKVDRCYYCYRLRIGKTITRAIKEGYSAFTTTLLASPKQQHELIISLCQSMAEEQGIDFVYFDFRTKYYQYYHDVKSMNLYLQNYCGCLNSKTERKNVIQS